MKSGKRKKKEKRGGGEKKKTKKQKNKEQTQSTTVRNFKQIRLGSAGGVGVSQTEQCASRPEFCLLSKTVGTGGGVIRGQQRHCHRRRRMVEPLYSGQS